MSTTWHRLTQAIHAIRCAGANPELRARIWRRSVVKATPLMGLCFALALALVGCGSSRPLTGFSVTPDSITPDGHSNKATAQIRYAVVQRADVTVALVGADKQRYVLRDRATRPEGSYALTFSGAFQGRVLPDGAYTVEITAAAPGGGPTLDQQTMTLTINGGDSTPPQLTETFAFPATFHPNGNLATDITSVHYTLSKPATINVYAIGKQLGKRYDIVFNKQIDKPGPQDAIWKGLVGTAEAVPDDDYTVHIDALDAAGNVGSATTDVTVQDSGIPEAHIVNVRFSEVTQGSEKLLKVEVQVENTGTAILYSWGPKPEYVYPSFHSTYLAKAPDGPDLPEEMPGRAGKYSVGIDFLRQPQDPPPYPWRWSFGKDLRPKEVVTVIGYVRLDPQQVGDIQLYAGLLHEGQGILSGQDHMGQQVVSVR